MTATDVTDTTPSAGGERPHILILGGGYVGLYVSRGLKKGLQAGEADVTVVDPRSYMTYQPFLPEVAAGSIEARHVVVPLRKHLKGVNVVTGSVTGLDHAGRTATVRPEEGEEITITYDHVVVALGSVSRVLPIPGLVEEAIGFKTVEEAAAVRDRVLDRLDAAASMPDGPERRRALSFVFVGGGYAGVEALGRILPEVGDEMGRWTLGRLRERGIDCRLETFLKACEGGHVVLSDGTEFDADTIVWTAGVKSNPVLANTDLPLDKIGRLRVRADLRVSGDDGIVDGAWGAGDCCAVPDLTKEPGSFCAPNAQHAVRESHQLARNLVSVLRGGPTSEYKHKYAGSVASLGVGKGVATIYGVKIKGFPAWMMHRGYHLYAIPTVNRKVRVLQDWIAGGVFYRDTTSLVRRERPRQEFEMSAGVGSNQRLAGAAADTGNRA